ncbi:MAG: SulP family inorganic anion transporter [Verrucomicrobiota bacterium]
MQKTTSLFNEAFRKDAIGGTIVFLIALPLCLGIAQASGAPPFAGIISGIIGGIVVGLLSKSNVSVSGPAAGLIAIVAGALLNDQQPFQFFLCSVVIAGFLQLVLGFLRAGGIANYFPSSVIEGMLAGIGLTIILKEFPNALGFAQSAQHEASTEGERGFNWADITSAFGQIEPAAMIISLLGLLILGLWLTKPMKRFQLIPAGLLVVVLGTLINELLKIGGIGVPPLGSESLVTVPVAKDFSAFLGQFIFPDFRGFLQPSVWTTGVVIAVVASIETLLCVEATDKLDPLKRYTPGNSELKAQGLGNLLSGFIGGLPITSVIVRSSANINAGARTKRSTIIHGFLLLAAVVTLGSLINRIPKPALSAILIFTGYRLCRPDVFKHMWKEGGVTQFVPFFVTVILVASLGLLNGVAVGLVLALIYTLRQNMRIPYFYQRSTYNNGELIKLTLSQEVSFLNKSAIKETLEHLPDGTNVIIDASHTEYIDFDVLDVIRDFAHSRATDKNINLSLVGFKDVYKVPNTLKVDQIVQAFVGQPEIPKREAGKYEKLMQYLRSKTASTPST